MKNYRVILTNGEHGINRSYRERVKGNYNELNGKVLPLLEEIAYRNEEIMKKNKLDKLKVNLEVTTYKFD